MLLVRTFFCVIALASVCVLGVATSHAQSVTKSRQATPDTYFKTLNGSQSKDGSQSKEQAPYTPPDFSRKGSATKTPVDASESVTWGDRRSILRDDPQAKNSQAQAIQKGPVVQASLEQDREQVDSLVPFEPGRVVAIVGGEPVFVSDMLFEVNQFIEKHMANAPSKAKDIQRKMLLKKLVNKYVDQTLLYVDALATMPEGADLEQFLVSAEAVFDDRVLPEMIESSGVDIIGDFDANLRVQNTSLRQVRTAWAKDQLSRNFLSEKLNVNLAVTHQELIDIYNENRESYHNKAKARWEQVMVRFDRFASREEAKKKIIELGNQIVYGANLEAVAKKHSHGFRAVNGGQHDWTSRNALMLDTLDKAIFSLPVDRLSDIIESKDGYHIVRVKERTEEGYVPFTEAQIEIRKKLKVQKQNDAFEKHLKTIRSQIPVEHFPLEAP